MGDRLRALLRAETLAVALIVLCPVVGIVIGSLTTTSSAPAGGGGAGSAATALVEPAQPARSSSGTASTRPDEPTPAVAARDEAPAIATRVGAPIPVVSRREAEELLEDTRLSDTDELILSELDRRGRLGLLFPERTGSS